MIQHFRYISNLLSLISELISMLSRYFKKYICLGLNRRRQWQPTPAVLPGKSHGRRSLVGYSPWGTKESGTTEWLHFLTIGTTNPLQALGFSWVQVKLLSNSFRQSASQFPTRNVSKFSYTFLGVCIFSSVI